MKDVDRVAQHSNRIAAICGALSGIGAAIVLAATVWTTFQRDYQPLPAKVSDLERRLDQIALPTQASLAWEGNWRGLWDGKWKVEFEMFLTRRDRFLVHYSHQNQQDGPLLDGGFSIGRLEGNTMTWESGTIRMTTPTTAVALGVFDNGVGRSAPLVKQPN